MASRELGEHAGFSQNPHRWRVAMARLREAEGALAAAFDLLDAAERLYNGDFSPNVRPISALKARVRIAQGDVGHALAWAHERHLSVDDDLSYLQEFEHVTLARTLLARHTTDRAGRPLHEATRLLERLLVVSEQGGLRGSVVEILALQALAQQDEVAFRRRLHRSKRR